MRYPSKILVILFLLSSLGLEAQTDITIRRKDFKVEKSGFDAAWKHVSDGDSYYSQRGIMFGKAFNEYLKASEYNNSNPELNYKLGVSALFSDNKERASEFFNKSIQLKSNVSEDILFLTGRSLQYSGSFSKAAEMYKNYLNSGVKNSDPNITLAYKYIDECNSASVLTADTLRIEISNAGPNINSTADDYSELITSDGTGIYFASRRQQPKSKSYYSDSKFDENIYLSNRSGDSWEPANFAGKSITTHYCEAPLYINKSNDSLFIYAGYENKGDIKVTVKKKGIWRAPREINLGINSKGTETSFTIAPSGNEIYFVTGNGKDNLGGKDIYFIKKINHRKWSAPKNSGPVINTLYDEESVRFSASGDTLWFSSKGHNSIGGFDIFYSVRNRAGDWDSVRNYGYPVNTPWDDSFYFPSPVDDSSFYFSSNRAGGSGGLDIYMARILPPEPVAVSDTVSEPVENITAPAAMPVAEPVPVPVDVTIPESEQSMNLIGKVKDSETGEPLHARH